MAEIHPYLYGFIEPIALSQTLICIHIYTIIDTLRPISKSGYGVTHTGVQIPFSRHFTRNLAPENGAKFLLRPQFGHKKAKDKQPLPLMAGQHWTTLDFEDMKFVVGMEKFDDWFARMEEHYKGLVDKYKILEETENKAGRDKLKQIRNEMPKANLVVGTSPPHIQQILETRADSLLFSPDSLAKQLYEYPELSMAEYRIVLGKIWDCKEIYQSKDLHAVLILQDGRWYQAVVKSTSDRKEEYLVSLHRLKKDSLSLVRKSKRLY